jgi:hypothetical protein
MRDVADRPVRALGGPGGLGGVLGDVAGQGGVGDLPVLTLNLCAGGGADLPQVQLRSPPEPQRTRRTKATDSPL